MPHQWKTKARGIRVPDDVWADAMAEAASRGETVSSAINDFLKRYGKRQRAAREGIQAPGPTPAGTVHGAEVP